MSFRASESWGEMKMMSRPGIVVRASVVVAVWGLGFGLAISAAAAQAAGKAAPSDPPVSLYQYAVPDGEAYFALAVRGETGKLPRRAIHTHAVLVDTSASQAGAYRKRAMEVANGYLAALGEGDRVRLFAIDVKAQPMMEEFASPQSDECRKGVQALSTRVPLGATDMMGGLRTALASLPVGVPATIVYVGDGMSAARLASFADLAEVSGELRGRQIAVHSFAVGPETDLEMLGTLAQQTGGVVLLDSAAGTSTATAIGLKLAIAAQAPVAYPTHLDASNPSPTADMIQMAPSTPLPIRGDRATIYLGKGRASEELTLSFRFAPESKTEPMTFRVRGAGMRNANGVLAFLWKRAQLSGGVVDSLAGARLLITAEDAFADRLAVMVGEAERAVAARDTATGEQMGRAVRALDPANGRAAAVLAAVERLKNESASHEILRQVAPEGSSDEAAKSPPPSPPLPAFPTTSSPLTGTLEQRVGPPREDAVTKYRQLMTVRGQQLTSEVNNAVVDARKIGADDPEAGIIALKRAESAVSTAADVEPQVRDQLTRRLRSTMQELRTIRERQTVDKVQNAERLAQVEARRRSLEQMSLRERRLTELIDQVRALLVQAVHGDDNAYEQGEAVAREALHLNPGDGPATQALYNSEMGGQINKAYRLRHLRADRLLEALYLVELAHVPFPDEPPIEWPNAQVWRALTERRKKWAQTDLRVESPTERRISEALDQTVDFTIDPEPLKDAIDFIAQRYSIPIMLDAKTLEDASIDTSAEVKMPVTNIKLRNMLKLLLEQLPTPLTYVIEDEVMKITTVEKANEKLQIRMYPVGDLVLGPDQLKMLSRSSGAMGGGMGGQGGGMGGQGGGMGGQTGGGGGGVNVGGGMFSVPSEVFPAQGGASDTPQSSSFTNESVQHSKKKRSDAR
jgi:hypothetical protein